MGGPDLCSLYLSAQGNPFSCLSREPEYAGMAGAAQPASAPGDHGGFDRILPEGYRWGIADGWSGADSGGCGGGSQL